ncbi:hypothetical protein ACFY8W_14560 [Streptomyces sp. NPDC012637]|uniref:hypothetical protein n=1 Tax=Streptomyces sp. NPDC012637 TaxID=3364842 RepID=UPI0036E06155
MNLIAYWTLIALCVGIEIWGQIIGLQDLSLVGVFAGLGVIAVHRLLLRVDRFEEFVEAGEEL